MKCAIIANGSMALTKDSENRIRACDLIICADGGAAHLRRIDILPHVLIGDFDSIAPADKIFLENNGVRQIPFPARKDRTDSELCIDYAIEKKVSHITLFGVTGTRLDHTLANVFLLKKLSDKNIPAVIIDACNEIYLVTSSVTLAGRPGDILSILPVTPKVTGVTLKGLEYPLTDATIRFGSSLGVSNRFDADTACVKIKTGLVLVIKSKD